MEPKRRVHVIGIDEASGLQERIGWKRAFGAILFEPLEALKAVPVLVVPERRVKQPGQRAEVRLFTVDPPGVASELA